MPYTTNRQFRVDGHYKSVRNNRRRLYKTATPTSKRPQKYFSELATYLAYFSVTYFPTSLKLAKFSVTERTAEIIKKMGQQNLSVHLEQLWIL